MCSMLEIYKENLYDLLAVNKADLRIKESLKKGYFKKIYILNRFFFFFVI